MNGNLLLRSCVLILGLFVAVMVTFEDLTDFRNNLSSLFNYLGAGLFIVGIVNPKGGIYLLLIVCGYLDFLKRCMVSFGRVYLDDVIVVLSVSPLLFAGICCGLMFSRARSRQLFTRPERLLFGLVVCFGLLALARVAQGSGGMRSVNSGIYIPMLLFAGMLFPASKDHRNYIRAMVLIFLPVAAYGMWQALYGFSDMELMYMETGLTVVRGGLDPHSAIRAFYTMISPHSFGAMMAILFTFSLYEAVYARRCGIVFWLVCALYLGGLASGLARTYWVMAAAMPVCFIAFRSRGLTIGFYGCVVTAGAVIVLSAGLLLENLSRVSLGSESSSEWIRQALGLQTYSDRLLGFQNWFNPEAWSLFGLGEMSASKHAEVSSHDVIGNAMITFGLVGVAGILAVVVFGLYLAHSKVLSVRDREARGLSICYLSVVFLFFASGAGSGGSFHVFPLNYMFWFATGGLAAILIRDAERGRSEVAQRGENSESSLVSTNVSAGEAGSFSATSGVVTGGGETRRGFPFRASGRKIVAGGGPLGEQADAVFSRVRPGGSSGRKALPPSGFAHPFGSPPGSPDLPHD